MFSGAGHVVYPLKTSKTSGFLPLISRMLSGGTERDKCRGGSRAAATSKMEHFVIIVNGPQPLTIITKHSILDVAAAPDLPLKWHELV